MAKKHPEPTCESELRHSNEDANALKAGAAAFKSFEEGKLITAAQMQQIAAAHKIIHHNLAIGNTSLDDKEKLPAVDDKMAAVLHHPEKLRENDAKVLGGLKGVSGVIEHYAHETNLSAKTVFSGCINTQAERNR